MAKEENKNVEALDDEVVGNASGGNGGVDQFNNIPKAVKDAKEKEERNLWAKIDSWQGIQRNVIHVDDQGIQR